MSCPTTIVPDSIGDEQRTQVFEQGFAVIDQLVDAETVTSLRDAYDELIDQRVHARGDRRLGGIIRQIKHPAKDHRTFADNAAITAGLGLGRVLFGRDDLAKVYEMLIDKPPGSNHPTPWHQDVGYFGRPVAEAGMRTDMADIQIWLALDPVDETNGCMQFIPTPYGTPARAHEVVSGSPDDESRLIALTEPVDETVAVACPLAAGGCTIHFLSTPHHTGPNLTTRPRRAYIFNIGLQTFASTAETSLEATWGDSARL